ncbi:hypothetical protein AYO20_05578 [Fonsecaea nubica]|uniref:Uncharacterized protein n=1 Tax=Fonsecaea nubica TaxID=856822 RepID=A0A178D1R8_9EURO|nr:hypothetical protein AYO20_05578 [Fonsecaea nubica]OAL35101.1 hypothetical protein AYO20_05578 [Fonsecaea nubica]
MSSKRPSVFPSPSAALNALNKSKSPPKAMSKAEAIRWAEGQPAPNNVPTSNNNPFGSNLPPSMQTPPQPPTLSSLPTLQETPEPGQASTNRPAPVPAHQPPKVFGRPGGEGFAESLPPQMNTGTGGAETPAYVQAFLDAGKPPPPPRVFPEEGVAEALPRQMESFPRPPPAASSGGRLNPKLREPGPRPLPTPPDGTPGTHPPDTKARGQIAPPRPLPTPPAGTPGQSAPTRPLPTPPQPQAGPSQ